MGWPCTEPTKADVTAAKALKAEMLRLAGDAGGLTLDECKGAVRKRFDSEYISDENLKSRCKYLVAWTKYFGATCDSHWFNLSLCRPSHPLIFTTDDLDKKAAEACNDRAKTAAAFANDRYYPCFPCFPAGAYVFAKTDSGVKPLTIGELAEKISAGETVLIAGRSDLTGTVEYRRVGKVIVNPSQASVLDVAYTTASGESAHILVTGNHPLANCGNSAAGTYNAADTFTAGAKLCGAVSGTGEVTSSQSVPFGEKHLYDISIVGGSHNFFVSSEPDLSKAVLAHNKLM